MPRVGARARVGHFGGSWETVVITGVHDEGRRIVVASEAGETLEFVLSRATAKWVPNSGPRGARLDLQPA